VSIVSPHHSSLRFGSSVLTSGAALLVDSNAYFGRGPVNLALDDK
jgi:hypothetical protein